MFVIKKCNSYVWIVLHVMKHGTVRCIL